MKRTPTNSSNIYAIGHDAERNILEVEFRENRFSERRIYAYTPVSAELYDEIRLSASLGSAFAAQIRRNPLIASRLVGVVQDGREERVDTGESLPVEAVAE